MKLSSNGSIEWIRSYGDNLAGRINNINISNDLTYIATGSIYDGNTWVLKINSDGNIVWQWGYHGDKRYEGRSIHQTDDEKHYYVLGSASGKILVMKLGTNGGLPSSCKDFIKNVDGDLSIVIISEMSTDSISSQITNYTMFKTYVSSFYPVDTDITRTVIGN